LYYFVRLGLSVSVSAIWLTNYTNGDGWMFGLQCQLCSFAYVTRLRPTFT